MLNQIRTSLFYASPYFADSELESQEGNVDEGLVAKNVQGIVELPDVVQISVYDVAWKWWCGSVAVTISIIMFILPTFYGFWKLVGKTSLSPFETARAFHAPILHDTSPTLDNPALLKAVGKKNVHTDLVVAERSILSGVEATL
jgi:hypothetical protein